MTVIGITRVKNEGRWVAKCVGSILPAVTKVLVLDDHSTDNTVSECLRLGNKVTVLCSPYKDLDEVRDKNFLLDKASEYKPDWIISIDGDEALMPGHAELLWERIGKADKNLQCLSLKILYIWDREDQIRVDGVYGDYHRESVFRPGNAKFVRTSAGGNFHCGNVPEQIRRVRVVTDITLLHYGYLHKQDRVRKYQWYNQRDPNNRTEDHYRHLVIGDLFPAESKFNHGGPLKLITLDQGGKLEAKV